MEADEAKMHFLITLFCQRFKKAKIFEKSFHEKKITKKITKKNHENSENSENLEHFEK